MLHPSSRPAANATGIGWAVAGALAVAVTFTGLGFWWPHGLDLLRQRYWAGIADARPFDYWVWGDLVALTCAIGLPAAVGLRRAFDRALRMLAELRSAAAPDAAMLAVALRELRNLG